MCRPKVLVTIACSFFLGIVSAFAQVRVDEVASPTNIKLNRERGVSMLLDIKDVLKDRYYDKTFHGIDIDARFKTAVERVKSLDTNWQIFRAIAQVLIEFDDSHTKFYPPSRANRVEYGFTMQMIGANCFVTNVKKGSDAESKGMKPGDQILAVNQYMPTRKNLWTMNYLLYSLDPLDALKLVVLDPEGKQKQLEIKSKFTSIEERRKEAQKKRKEKQENPYRCQAIDAEVLACRLETFSVEKKYIDKMMGEASKFKKLILDLRGNGGGYVVIEEYLTGHFFDRDVKIADFVMRNKTKERIAKVQKERNFKGELVVLIDSNSASASEVFARVIQLNKRGIIVGDISAGAVMTSNFIGMQNSRGVPGYETLSFFAVNVTVADLIMSDGNRLEKVGVTPDHLVGPSASGLLLRSDPVLAYASNLVGVKISSEDAGKFNFIYKKDEDEDEETDDEPSGN